MNYSRIFCLSIAFSFLFGCTSTSTPESTSTKETTATKEQIAVPFEKMVLDAKDPISGYYLAVPPKSGNIKGVLVLLPGFGQLAENIFPATDLENEAYLNDLLTIGFSMRTKLYADKITRKKLTAVLNDVLDRYKVSPDKFVLGGFSAGGNIALRYTELCKEFPNQYPIHPQGVFIVDSPVDIFTIWDSFEEAVENNYTKIAVDEANWAMKYIKDDYGVPRENIPIYAELTSFSMNKEYSQNEVHLKDVAVRTYHDVDIAWRLEERNQPVRLLNFMVTSEMINRLRLLGNTRAEFIQSYQTGYRSNGKRHPHSWSIIDEQECMQWISNLL